MPARVNKSSRRRRNSRSILHFQLGSIVESLMNRTINEGRSISRPPYFDGTNYSDWKERVMIFIQSVDFKVWLVIKNGPKIPKKKIQGQEMEKPEDEFDDEDINKMELEAKAKHILYCAINPDAFKQISKCKTAKEMWDKLDREMAVPVVVNSIAPELSRLTAASAQYNFPNNDFLEETREAMDNFLKWCVPLQKYAVEGNWPAAKRILDQDDRLKHAAIAKGLPTVLHVAAGASHTHFVKQLLPSLQEDHIGLQDVKGNTAFCFAAAAGNFEIVNMLVKINPHLPLKRGGNGLTPVQFAALHGNCEMASHLLDISRNQLEKEDRELLFFTCITTGNYRMYADHWHIHS